MHPKPDFITRLEAQYQLAFIGQEAETIDDALIQDFVRYGRAKADRAKYLLDETGRIRGLALRTCELTAADWLNDPALTSLQALNLTENKLTTLTIPATLKELRHLDVSDNPELATLELPQGGLPQLTYLDASDSGLTTFALPAGCTQLDWLDVSRNQLRRCELAGELPALRYLDVSKNASLRRLELQSELLSLQYVYAGECGMEHFSFKDTATKLAILDLRENRLRQFPADIILDSPLTTLYGKGNAPKNIPRVFLDESENALADARIWFQELRRAPGQSNKTVKLIISGNGNVGKSSILHALQSDDLRCPLDLPTTEGIDIGFYEDRGTRLRYWDFGGQEIYHGTHRLFISDEAVQVLVFDPVTEKLAEQKRRVKGRKDGEELINHVLDYWFDTARELSPNSEFLIIQNKDGLDPTEYPALGRYRRDYRIDGIQADALEGTGMDKVKDTIRILAQKLPAYDMEMPASWLAVREFCLQNVDSADPVRSFSREEMLALCRQKEVPEPTVPLLLRYLHHGGFIYLNERYLENTVILDQRWALDAIYSCLPRGEDALEYRDLKGLLRVQKIFNGFDQTGQHYTPQEKWTLLHFMEACGLCFRLNREEEQDTPSLKTIYAFPEYFPVAEPPDIAELWESKRDDSLQLRLQLPYVNYPRIQAFITSLGRKTAIRNIWRNGIHVRLGPEEGSFRVQLNYATSTLAITLDRQARPFWLESIRRELDYPVPAGQAWEISEDGGTTWRTFDWEEWKKGVEPEDRFGAHHEAIAEDNPVKSLDQISDVEQEIDYEIVLFLIANPAATAKIPYDTEFGAVFDGLDECAEPDRIKIKRKPHARITDLIDRVNELGPHWVHFVGHGEKEDNSSDRGGLIFLSDDGREYEEVKAAVLTAIFDRLIARHDQLIGVVLNACFSRKQARAISRVGPKGLFAIGTESSIGSVTARRFAVGFYKKYAETLDPQQAAINGLDYATSKIGREAAELIHLYHNGEPITL